MKTSTIFLSTAIVLLTALSTVSAESLPVKEKTPVAVQQNTCFTGFRTHRQGTGVTASWSVQTTEDIVGFSVQRTYEDPTDPYAYWEDLGVVPFNPTRSFTYKDLQVFPGTVNYRIVALLSDGNSVTSEISSVRIISRH